MINSTINELTVYADKLEDEGVDVSCLRILCEYNYIFSVIFYDYNVVRININNRMENTGDGSSNYFKDEDDAFGFGLGYDNGYLFPYTDMEEQSLLQRIFHLL